MKVVTATELLVPVSDFPQVWVKLSNLLYDSKLAHLSSRTVNDKQNPIDGPLMVSVKFALIDYSEPDLAAMGLEQYQAEG